MVPPTHTFTFRPAAGWRSARRELCLQTPVCKAHFQAHGSCPRTATTPVPGNNVAATRCLPSTPGAPPAWTPPGLPLSPRSCCWEAFPDAQAQAGGPQVTRKVREKCPRSRPGTVRAQSLRIGNYQHIEASRPKRANSDLYLQMKGPHSELRGRGGQESLTPQGSCPPPPPAGASGLLGILLKSLGKENSSRGMPHLAQAPGSPPATRWTQEQSPTFQGRVRDKEPSARPSVGRGKGGAGEGQGLEPGGLSGLELAHGHTHPQLCSQQPGSHGDRVGARYEILDRKLLAKNRGRRTLRDWAQGRELTR